jgi:hypothetical protein
VEKMKTLAFILYLLKHGSLKSNPVNFQKIEAFHLGLQKENEFSLYRKIRSAFALNKFTGSLTANLAYAKNLSRQHINFFFVDDLKIGYVRILKSASTSILRELIPLIDSNKKNQNISDKQIDLLAAYHASQQVPQAKSSYEFFTIVRDPFQRLVSVYQDLFNPTNPHFGYENYLFGIMKRSMSFHEFVEVISNIPDKFKSGHFIQQTSVINQCGGLKKIKCFRIEKDTSQLQAYLKSKNINLTHRNKSAAYDYRDFYNSKTLQLAYSIYKADVEAFDYHDEYKALFDYLNG